MVTYRKGRAMAVAPLDRKLLAILAADIVGFSAAMEADEPGTIARVMAVHTELLDRLIDQYRGRIVKLMGDGTLVTFDSVVDAVACGAKIQTALAERNAGSPQRDRVMLRIGVNVGDVALIEGDVYGDAVNIAARLEQLCDPGAVVISGAAFDHLQGKLDYPIDFVGERQLKNIVRPVRVYRVRLDGKRLAARVPFKRVALIGVILGLASGVVWWMGQPEAMNAKPSIAVVPFSADKGDQATSRIAGGLTDDIITDLSRMSEVDVIARHSTDPYQNKMDALRVGRDLGVGYILHGSIQREGLRIRVNAQLVDAENGVNLWSQRWDRPAEDLFAIQSEIAEHVFSQFEMITGPIKSPRLELARRKSPRSLSAYELTLLGVEKQLSPTRESDSESVAILKKATEVDPEYARAWVGLSWAHSLTADYGAAWAPAHQAAIDAAERAVALDPNDADARGALGEMLARQGKFDRAKAELETALRLNPGSFSVLTYYLSWASAFGEPARGADLADRAVKLNPNYQPWASGGLRYAYFMAGRYDDALKVMERQKPENYSKYAWAERAGSLAMLGRKTEADAAVKEALQRFPDLSIEAIANDPAFNAAEHQRHIETMRLAGFPPCASGEVLAGRTKPLRLPECVAKTSP